MRKGLTMSYRYAIGAFAVAMLAVTGMGAGGGLKSGPQVGEEVPGAFFPLNITGKQAGQEYCLV